MTGKRISVLIVALLVAGLVALLYVESWVKDRDARRLREQARRELDTPVTVDCAHLLLARNRQLVVLVDRTGPDGSSCGGLVTIQYRRHEGDAPRESRSILVRGRVLHTTLGTVLADAADVATP